MFFWRFFPLPAPKPPKRAFQYFDCILDVINSTLLLSNIENDISFTLNKFLDDLVLIKVWIDSVNIAFKPIAGNSSTFSKRFIKSESGSVRGNFELDGFSFQFKFNMNSGTVTTFSRLSTVMPGGNFLLFNNWQHELIKEIGK